MEDNLKTILVALFGINSGRNGMDSGRDEGGSAKTRPSF
jgi:hypothetical protein